MSGISLPIILIIALIILFFFYGTSIYNALIRLRNEAKNAFAQIDVQLKRRYDLIPNLVETTKGYLTHEKETLEKVIQARNQAFSANQKLTSDPQNDTAMKGLLNAESLLSGAVSRLMVLMENYPDLKANQNIAQLTEELTSTENRISYARQHYNDSVMEYNTSREVFPRNIVANFFNFHPFSMWEILDLREKENIKVSFK